MKEPGHYKDLGELRDDVEVHGDVKTVPAWAIRNAYGADRLGVVVRENISKAMKGLGLGHVPMELPGSAGADVRVYRLGSAVADIIEAVMTPGDGHDERIKRAAGGGAAAMLARVREIVCEPV